MKRAILSTKRLRLALALFLVVGTAATALLWPKPPPQIITLPTGDKYQFVGVTYGTNHFFGMLPRLVSHLPTSLVNFARNHAGSQKYQFYPYQTATPCLCVWFRELGPASAPLPGTPPIIILSKLVDDHGLAAGSTGYELNPVGVRIIGAFAVVPRRSRILEMRLFAADQQQRVTSDLGWVRFPNPLYGHFPQWQPQSVPAVTNTGDFQVRLNSFEIGRRSGNNTTVLEPGNPAGVFIPFTIGRNAPAISLFNFTISVPDTNTDWVPDQAEFGDATGNVLPGTSEAGPFVRWPPSMGSTASYMEALEGTLWPDEAAWRLKLAFKRTSGFPTADLVKFNLAVPKANVTNGTSVTRSAGGVPITLRDFQKDPLGYHFGPPDGPFWIEIELPTKPSGVVLDFVDITTDTGVRLNDANGWSRPYFQSRSFSSMPTNTRSLNITCVVQKIRSVEFYLKPPKTE